MKYKVLWIDDDCNTTGRDFIGHAEQDDVDITAFESHEEGMGYLEKHLDDFQAVILDAKVKHKKNDTVTDLEGLRASRDRLIELNNNVDIDLPYFIFTGQPDYQTNELFQQSFGDFYIKGKDNERLIEEIILRITESKNYILRKKYRDVLATCSNHLLGNEHFSRLFSLIKHIENVEKLTNTEDMLTPIRKVIERMFTRMAECEIIPEAIISNKGWINGSSLFLANKHSDYEHLSEIIPPLVGENIHRLLNITQDGSHAEGELRLKVDQYLKNVQSDFLYKSCVFLLFDLLLWFKDFIEENPHKDINRTRWKIKDWITGSVSQINPNGWGTFQPDNASSTIGIPPNMVTTYNLKEGDSIKITTKPSHDGTKPFIKNISR